jgi:hypothetical protein
MPTSLTDWLGPAAGQLNAEQLTRVEEEARRIGERYPDPDEQPERDAALSAVVQYLLGETTPDELARALTAARLAQARAYAAALAVGVVLVGDGSKKLTAANAVGVDRMSLLKALGER